MKIVIINGTSRVGKDKFVSYFKYVTNGELRVKNYSSIDRVKHIAEICFGWNGKKDNESRLLLSEIKSSWTKYNDGPFNIIQEQISTDVKWCKNKGKNTDNNIYFVHVREPSEITKYKKIYEERCITLLIRKVVDFIPDNTSDKNVENFNYDYIVDNNKSERELKKRANEFLKHIKKTL